MMLVKKGSKKQMTEFQIRQSSSLRIHKTELSVDNLENEALSGKCLIFLTLENALNWERLEGVKKNAFNYFFRFLDFGQQICGHCIVFVQQGFNHARRDCPHQVWRQSDKWLSTNAN